MSSSSTAIAAGLALTAAALSGCAHRADTAPAPQASGAGKPPVAVAVAPATATELVESVDVVGSLAPKFAADVKSEVTGIVDAVYVTEWVPVRKNGELARLDVSETKAALDALRALEAQAAVAETRARREHDRARQLQQYGLITPQALDDAKSAVDAAEAGTLAAHAQVRTAEARLAKAFIRAPMDGVVAQRSVNVGDRVENMGSGSPMFRIVDNRVLELTVIVPASRLAGVQIGQAIEFTTDAVPGRTFTGKVMFINPAVDETNRSARVVCDVPNNGGTLKGGLFVKGRIITATRAAVLQVPRDALLNWNVSTGAADVFVARDGAATRRQVRTGATSGATVEIRSGVTAGEPVVTRGGFALRDGDRIAIAKSDES